MVKVGDPEKAKILVLAPTGVAAVSISSTTIHSGLGKKFGRKMFPLNDRQRTSLRNKPSEVRFIIIDENSVVSSMIFYQVNERLNKLFRCRDSACFGGLPVLACGNFYQLPPVK